MRFLKNIVTVAALCATFASALTQNATDGYYELSSAQDLREFVAGINGGSIDQNAKVRLTQNISLTTETIVSFNESGAVIKLPQYNTIAPIQKFSGTFDGQGFSISGIYIGGPVIESIKEVESENDEKNYDTTWTHAREAAFIINLENGAKIKDLRILDSYFDTHHQAGSLAARASGNISIQGYQFSGVIKADSLERKCPEDETCEKTVFRKNSDGTPKDTIVSTAGDIVGGVIGHVQSEANLTMSNLIVESWFTHNRKENGGNNVGGFIGVNDGKIDFYNSYSKVLIVNKRDRGIQGNSSISTLDNAVNTHGSAYCSGTGDKCNIKDLCKNEAGSQTNINVCRELFGNKLAELFNTDNSYKAHGVTFEYNSEKNILIAHITEWTRNEEGNIIKDALGEKDSVLDYLEIPKEIYVDSVDFDRVFSGKSSTVTLPFDIEPSKVTAASSCTDFDPLKFNKFNSGSDFTYNETDKKYEAKAGTETEQILAHYPYLVDGVNGRIHFCGPITLKQTRSNSGKYSTLGNWQFYGTYKTMLTTSDGGSAYESSGNLGRIYGFVGTTNVPYKGESTFSIGQFAKAGHNVRTREMRAYLIHRGDTIAPMAAPPYRNMNRAAPAATVLDLSDEDLPNSIDVIVEEKEIIMPTRTFIKDTTIKPTVIVSTIKLEYPSGEDEEDDDPEEGTTFIKKPLISPLKSNKLDSWRDIKGRRLNGRPNVPGTYFKNGIPVIIK